MFIEEADVYDRTENRTASTLGLDIGCTLKSFNGSYLKDLHVWFKRKTSLRAETSGSISRLAPPLPQFRLASQCLPKLRCKELKTTISQNSKHSMAISDITDSSHCR